MTAMRPFLLAAAAALLAGCASLTSLDSDVSSYSQWPAGRAPGRYVFERLPSQQAKAEQQAQLEAAARPALAEAGFTEAASAGEADVTVQLGARVTRWDPTPWSDPYWRGAFGWGWPYYGRGAYWGLGLHYEPPRYDREVAILIRDRKSGAALYESRATNDDTYAGGTPVLAAMFAAAMKDFPTPAVNPRRVTVPLAPQ